MSISQQKHNIYEKGILVISGQEFIVNISNYFELEGVRKFCFKEKSLNLKMDKWFRKFWWIEFCHILLEKDSSKWWNDIK